MSRSLTPCQDVNHKDDEAENAASGAILPRIGLDGEGWVVLEGGCECEGSEAQLEEEAEHGGDCEYEAAARVLLVLLAPRSVCCGGEDVMFVPGSCFLSSQLPALLLSRADHATTSSW